MIKKLAITAFALSMSAAFAGTDKSTVTSTNSAQPSVSIEAPKSSMASSSADSSQVKQVQQALKDKGQDPGAIDGKMGPKTTAALQSFQQAQGISGSGLDQPTLAALGVSGSASASASTGSTSSNQPSASSNQPAASSNQPAASANSTSSSQPAASSNQPAASTNQPSSTNQSSSTNVTKQ